MLIWWVMVQLVCLSTPPVFFLFFSLPHFPAGSSIWKKGLHGERHTFKNNTKQNVWGQGKPRQMNKPCGTVLTKQALPHQCSWTQLSREMPSSGKFQTQQVSHRKNKSWSTSEFPHQCSWPGTETTLHGKGFSIQGLSRAPEIYSWRDSSIICRTSPEIKYPVPINIVSRLLKAWHPLGCR